MRRWIAAAAVVLLGAGQARAFEVGARAAYWVPALSGEVRLDGTLPGTRVDLADDLGITDENFFFGDAWVWLGDHHLTLSAARIDYSGSETLSGVVFGDYTFSGPTDTSIEYTVLDLTYRYDLVDLENVLAGLSVGPELQAKYLDGEVRMEAAGVEERRSFQIPVPMVGLGGHVGILADLLEVRARIAIISLRGDRVLEASGEVAFSPLPFVDLTAGYRHFDIDVEEGDLLLSYTQSGPYVGLGIVF